MNKVVAISSAIRRVRDQEAEDAAFLSTRAARESVAALGHVALCLIGPSQPVTFQRGNALHWPVKLVVNTVPSRATQRDLSAHWEGSKDEPHLVLLGHRWTASDAHVDRLKRAVYARMIEDDPAMRLLNASWIDMMDWDRWPSLLAMAHDDLLAAGEIVEYWNDAERTAIVRAHAAARLRKATKR